MATDLRPRRLAHRGHVLVHGVLHGERRGVDAARREVLDSFQPGVRVYDTPSGLVSVWPRAWRLAVPLPAGAPLVRYRSLLSCVPLTPGEVEYCASGRQVFVEARAGQFACSALEPELEVDPSEWLNVDDFESLEAFELTAPPAPPAPALAPAAESGRAALDSGVRRSPRAAAELVRALVTTSHGPRRAPGPLSAFVADVVTAVKRAFSAFAPWSRDAADLEDPRLPPARTAEPALERSLLGRLSEWWKRLLWRSQLGRWLGRQHAQYLTRLFEMFEQGDFDQALRYAIPASKAQGGDSSLALLPPSPRTSIEFSGPRAPGGGVGLGLELHGHLRELYRRAFHELERRGEILKAAFVLSELLEDDAEAVSFLERHGKLTQAAKLAEVRELNPGLIVRQWFIAGDRDRAVMIARRDGAFEEAVERLRDQPELYQAFCRLWAAHLAQSGDFGRALMVLAGLGPSSSLPVDWLERAVEIGGVTGARALGLWARFRPESFAEVRGIAHDLIADSGPAWSSARLALGNLLSGVPGPDTPERHALLRGVTRALIADHARGFLHVGRRTVEYLSSLSVDGALRADLPPLLTLEELPRLNPAAPRTLLVNALDLGVSRFSDVVLLENGCWLLAKGEAGVVLLGRDFRLIHHFDVPASSLVVSSQGDRVLALAERDAVTLVARIDVPGRRCQHWTELELTAHAREFDGAVWYVGIGSRIHALDVVSDGSRALWQSADAGAPILEIAASSTQLCFATATFECWQHELGPHRLSHKHLCDNRIVLTASGPVAELGFATDRLNFKLISEFGQPDREFSLPDAHARDLRQALASPRWILVGFQRLPRSCELRLFERQSLKPVFSVVLHGAEGLQVRLDDERLLVCDDRGRVLGFDLNSGSTIADARL